jgi:valyl-tRNA synthetase
MNASGYREKAPQSKQDDDMKKLASLLDELEIIREAESKLDPNN